MVIPTNQTTKCHMTEDHNIKSHNQKKGLQQNWKKSQFESVLMDAELQKAS
jgi:hypothetical protein